MLFDLTNFSILGAVHIPLHPNFIVFPDHGGEVGEDDGPSAAIFRRACSFLLLRPNGEATAKHKGGKPKTFLHSISRKTVLVT